MSCKTIPKPRSYQIIKRCIDVCGASLGLLLVSPVLALAAAAILLESGRPVFFLQKRVGRGGVPFLLFKLRTMTAQPEASRPVTSRDDPRITRLGRVLRSLKIDELPQLANVLRGEMSLVGPRPEVPKYVAHFNEEQRAVLSVRPGLTDPASIKYAEESGLLAESEDPEALYLSTILPDKLKINLNYIQDATIATDLGVICRTLLRIIQ